MRYRLIAAIAAVTALFVCCSKNPSVPETSADPSANPSEEPSLDPEFDPLSEPEATGHFVILSWSDIVYVKDAAWKYKLLVDGGFNTYLGWYGTYAEVEESLTCADEAGLSLIISSPELESDTEATVKLMCKHKSLAGYHIKDEPEVNDFSYLAKRINDITKYDDEHPCYVNIYPNWAWGGEVTYRRRVDMYLDRVPVKYLSFDCYPIKKIDGKNQVRSDWYHGLEDIRGAAKDHNMPFWAFALALGHATNEATYEIPTIGDLRLQQFSNLVYGATGFQYFTTWGIIHDDGATNVYYDVKRVNEELIGLEPVFYGADVIDVWHTGETIPTGTKALQDLPDGIKKIETSDEGAVVSYIKNGGRQYIALVNKSCIGGMDLTIEFDEGVTARKVTKQSKFEEFEPGTIRIPAGDIAIYTWK